MAMLTISLLLCAAVALSGATGKTHSKPRIYTLVHTLQHSLQNTLFLSIPVTPAS